METSSTWQYKQENQKRGRQKAAQHRLQLFQQQRAAVSFS